MGTAGRGRRGVRGRGRGGIGKEGAGSGMDWLVDKGRRKGWGGRENLVVRKKDVL